MSILWMDDPSYYNTTQGTSIYFSFDPSVVPGAGRFGSASWQFGNATNRVSPGAIFSSIPTATVGVSFEINAITGNSPLITFLDSGTEQVQAQITSGGNLKVFSNGVQIGPTSTNIFLPHVWYRLEFKATINNTTGVIEVRVNGSSTGWIPQTTGLNTRVTANNSLNQFSIGGFQSGTANANDLIFTDENTPNAGFLGDKRCFLLTPASDSSVQWVNNFASYVNGTAYVLGQQLKDPNNNVQRCTTAGTASNASPTWSTTGGGTTSVGGGCVFTCVGSGSNPGAHNWMAVSETPADGDNSYNSSATPNDVDLLGITSLPLSATNISAVNVIAGARKDDAGTRTFQRLLKSATTQVNSSTDGLTSTLQFYRFINETDPNTSAAWTPSAVNAALIGYKEIT